MWTERLLPGKPRAIAERLPVIPIEEMRNGRPDIGAPQYAEIVTNYVHRIRARASAEGRDRQVFALQLLSGDAKTWDILDNQGLQYPANSFLGYLLHDIEKRLGGGETLSDIIDYVDLNNYRTMADGKPTVFNAELSAVRSIIAGRLPSAPFVYTQLDVGERPAERNDRDTVAAYHDSLQAAVDALEIMANVNETPDIEHACWDFILGSIKMPSDGAVQFTPLYQAFRLARSMPVQRYAAEAPDGVRVYASMSERSRGDGDDSAAVLLWSRAGSGAKDVEVTLKHIPSALIVNDQATAHIYRMDVAHYGTIAAELAKPLEARAVACKNGAESNARRVTETPTRTSRWRREVERYS